MPGGSPRFGRRAEVGVASASEQRRIASPLSWFLRVWRGKARGAAVSDLRRRGRRASSRPRRRQAGERGEHPGSVVVVALEARGASRPALGPCLSSDGGGCNSAGRRRGWCLSFASDLLQLCACNLGPSEAIADAASVMPYRLPVLSGLLVWLATDQGALLMRALQELLPQREGICWPRFTCS
ncbi:hypothetical protein CDD83_8401 [Cordyceps sp. RAO-2017]|nr:hypothetical protein CDD83_8401 [Cordyceps sp. RAO-2017]